MRKSLFALAFMLSAAGLTAAPAQPLAATETVLHSFGGLRGANPAAGLAISASGNFYGATSAGGTADLGVVYMLTAGAETVLHNFTGGADGAVPYAGVIFDANGNLYGTTYQGGGANAGVIYKVDAAGQETVLYSFLGGSDGANPQAELALDADGNLYGTTSAGGSANAGTVFKLDASGNKSVLYSFTGGADGGKPMAGLIIDSAGDVYGTAAEGGLGSGDFTFGVVFKLSSTGQETVLYSFTGGADGYTPSAKLARDPAGNLYGTTAGGGAYYAGVVFELDAAGNQSVLYNFKGPAYQSSPSGVILDSSGNLYGTNRPGGYYNLGCVFRLEIAARTVSLYNFNEGATGFYPEGGVVRDSAGNLYGTTYFGGPTDETPGNGFVFKLDPFFTETVLFSFTDPVEGINPAGGVIRDSAGNFYGTTIYGGAHGQGAVYKVGANGAYSVLHSFTGGEGGGMPYFGVIRDDAGNLYGTARGVRRTTPGVVFQIAPTGAYTVLHRFTPSDVFPNSGVVPDGTGNFYGTTQAGGGDCPGSSVYKLDAGGNYTVLFAFTGVADGCEPQGVILDSAGNLYGTASSDGPGGGGVVFKVDPAGQETVLYSFPLKGPQWPAPGLVRDATGNLFGATLYGGLSNYTGVVFKLNTSGQLHVLYDFPSSQEVLVPSGLVRDAAGDFYGTTTYGGSGDGSGYKLDAAGHLLAEYSFPGGSGGYSISSGVILDRAGNLYGTASAGGSGGNGVVFQLRFAAPK